MKLIIEKQEDGGVYGYTVSEHKWRDIQKKDLVTQPKLPDDTLSHDCDLNMLRTGHLIFDLAEKYKRQQIKFGKKKKKAST